MDQPPNPPDRKPIIWAMSISRLRQAFDELIPQYLPVADIRVVEKGFEDALPVVREAMRAGQVDALVAAGSNGSFLRRNLALPVALVNVGGFDLLGALTRARRASPRIAVVMHQSVTPELSQFISDFDLSVETRSYAAPEDARDTVRELAASGIGAVVGPGLISELAEQAGIAGVFLYSIDSVRQALDDAIEIVRLGRVATARRERLDTILRQLNEGVVAVDMQERVETLNPAMERLLGAEGTRALGRSLRDIAPGLSLRRTLDRGSVELEQIENLGSRTLVVNRMPILEQGVQTGAVLTVQDATMIQRVDRSLRSGKKPRQFVARYELAQLIGESPAMRRLREQAQRFAGTDATVLIVGESGTGKEVLAQGIHNASPRRRHPFVAINCAALPEALLESELFGYEEGAFTGSRRGGKPGLFELAHTGTLLLDEIGEMPLALQTRLLRVLQEQEVLRLGATEPTPVDVRVMAATHRDLSQQIETGDFRQDLYYRLNILRLEVPPLRDRAGDVAVLAAYLLDRVQRRNGHDGSIRPQLQRLLPRLIAYPWPGNVRELENVIERLVVYQLSHDASAEIGEVELADLLPELPATRRATTGDAPGRRSGKSLKSIQREAEKAHIRQVLDACGGNRDQACRELGITRSTLWRKLRD